MRTKRLDEIQANTIDYENDHNAELNFKITINEEYSQLKHKTGSLGSKRGT